jgi:FkbM family methyltransferase
LRRAATHWEPDNWLRKRLARIWNTLLRHTGRYVSLQVQGQSIRLLVDFRSFDQNYESATLQVFLSLIGPGDTVWDVGANIGIYTLLAGHAVCPTGKVVSWEPGPETYQVLQEHIRANGLQKICEPLAAAVSDGCQTTVFFLNEPDLSSTSRLAVEPGPDTIQVPAASLDTWAEKLGRRPQMIKVDVEGAEVLVMRGASRLMEAVARDRPMFVVAIHPQFLPEFGSRPEEMEGLLAERGYLALDGAGRPARPIKYAEYLFLPREACERVQNRFTSSLQA